MAVLLDTKLIKEKPLYAKSQYIKRLPKDPWRREYQYKYPGTRNTSIFDLWTYGADNLQGETGLNSDFGNWPGGFDKMKAERIGTIFMWHQGGMLFGFVIGLPIYLAGIFKERKNASKVKSIYLGFHFKALLYLVIVFPVFGVAISVIPIYMEHRKVDELSREHKKN